MKNKIINFIYIWLPRVFGCHCRSDRSFFYKGKQFPICARCTGELIGMLIGIVCYSFIDLRFVILLLMLIPMLIDGFLQLLTNYKSNNFKRVVTGFLFGFSLIYLFIGMTLYIHDLGYSFGLKLFKDL